ncbi:FtsX-like permease family protein [Cohnella endophytica]|uniref:FtsX-like permease family protein n=1 Tax=Cohnella endophytica TaxID=2419778 RepID=A0A494XME7_9BACL|nr:FtsX-like permease family protein [Cohnella endophytica]RKP49856.1 FtsX-like permease family protein [Cohnella endophytica]
MSLWQNAWRNLMRRKLRTLLTFVSIVIGVSATFGVIASVDTAKRAFPLYLKEAFGKADFTVSGTEAYFPEEVHKEILNLPNVDAVAVLKQSARLRWEQKGISAIEKRVDLSGYSNLDTPLTAFKVTEGNLTSGGAVITDRTAAVWKVSVGDTLSIDTDSGTKEIKVSAIVKYTSDLMGPSSWMMAKYHPWSIAVPLKLVQDWFGLPGKIETVQIKSQTSPEAVQQQADERIKRYGNIYLQPVVIDFDTEAGGINTFYLALYIAGFLGIALSAFVIFNSLFVSIKERKNEFAALKTIGYTTMQLQALVLSEVILLAVVGTAAGLAVGYGFAYLLKAVIFMLFGLLNGGSMLLGKGFAVSALAGILVPIAAALYPIRQAGKVSVIQALKEDASVSSSFKKWQGIAGVVLIASAFFIKHLLLVVPILIGVAMVYPYLFQMFVAMLRPIYGSTFGFSGKVAASNLGRNLGRTSMTSVILCLGIAMIVLMSSLNSALVQSYEKVIYSSYGGNLDVMLHHIEKTDLEDLKRIKGVKDAQTYRVHDAIWTLDGQKRKLPVYGVGAEWIDRFPLYAVTGKKRSELIEDLGPNEILMSKIAYGIWGGKVGDQIELGTLHGTQSFKVAAIVQSMKNGGYGIYMKEDAFIASFGPKYEKNALVLKEEGTSPLELRERIFDQFGVRIMKMFGPEDWVSIVGSAYTGSFAIIDLLIILSVIISGIGITNTLLMNIMERVRELGMMRAVGVTRGQLIRMVMLEGFGIGLAATVVGCVFGILLIYLTSTFLEVNSLTYQFGIPIGIMLIIVSFGILISLVSSFTPASRAAKTRLSEALRYE